MCGDVNFHSSKLQSKNNTLFTHQIGNIVCGPDMGVTIENKPVMLGNSPQGGRLDWLVILYLI